MVQVKVDLSWWLMPDQARVKIRRVKMYEGDEYAVVVENRVEKMIRLVHFHPHATFNARCGTIFLET